MLICCVETTVAGEGQYNGGNLSRGLPAQEPKMFGFLSHSQQVDDKVQDEFIERVHAAAEDFLTAVSGRSTLDYTPRSVDALDRVLDEVHHARLTLTPMQRVGAAAY